MEALLDLLEARGLVLDAPERERIERCEGPSDLRASSRRAPRIGTAAKVFD